MLPPVPTTLPGTPLTSPAVPWNVIEFTVGTTGVGTMDDGRSAAGGGEEEEAGRLGEEDAAFDRRERVDVGDEVVVQRRHPVGVEEPDRVAVQDESVGIQPAEVDPVLEAVVGDGPHGRLDAVRGAVAAGDLGEVVGVDPAGDRRGRARDAAHRDVPHRDAAGLGRIDDGRGDGAGGPVDVARCRPTAHRGRRCRRPVAAGV